MTNRSIVLGSFCVVALSLIALAFLPPSMDQAVFAAGGRKMIFQGALPYKDIFDMKPPGLFYLYGIASYLFGSSLLDFRILDAFFHAATLALFYFFLKARLGNNVRAAACIALYALMIVSLGTDNTTQAETFSLLPSLVTFMIGDIVARNGSLNARRVLLFGFATGLLFVINVLLKYTLVAPTFAALLFITLQDIPRRVKLLFIGSSVTSILLLAGLCIWLMQSYDILEYAKVNLDFLTNYSFAGRPLTFESIQRLSFTGFSTQLVLALSPAVFIFTVLGVYRSIRGSTFHQHMLIQLLAGGLMILGERKNFLYHFARLFWVVAPFTIAGIAAARPIFAYHWRASILYRFGIIIALCLLLFFSPLATSMTNGFHISYLAMRSGVRSPSVQKHVGNMYYNSGGNELADSLAAKLQPTDDVYIFGSNIMPYLFLDKLPPTPQLNSYQFQGIFAEPKLQQRVMEHLQHKPPRFIAIETGDIIDFITQSGTDSFTAFVAWDELFNFVLDHYNDLGIIGGYEVYERTEE